MDVLLYRFPLGKKQKLFGEFSTVDLSENKVNGFIISSFDKLNSYVFKEESDFKAIDFSFHSSKEIPFVISKSDSTNSQSIQFPLAAIKHIKIDTATYTLKFELV